MNTIYRDMNTLLSSNESYNQFGVFMPSNNKIVSINDLSSFYDMSIQDKYVKVKSSIKTFLLSKLFYNTKVYNEYKDKSINEIISFIESTSKDENDPWVVVLYVLKMVSLIKDEIPFIIWENYSDKYKDKIFIDYEKKSINTYQGISARKMYDFIEENVFNLDYLRSAKLSRTPCK